jgi:hypothetical protein
VIFLEKFISIWNEIKKIPSFMGKKTAVDQLNDTTVFPVVLNLFKNFSENYRKYKSNCQEKILKELHVHFLKETENVRIYSITRWEKVNKFVIKSKPMQFFSILWNGFSGHANLLNWISFLLLFFSLSLYSYPIIFLILGISLVGYLSLRIFYLVKDDSIIFPGIYTDQSGQILESVKVEVFNEGKNRNEFKLIQEISFDLSGKNLKINEFFNSISTIQKKINFIYLSSLSIQQSKLYQYLTEVYPKTQFIASLTVNLTSVVLYTYLLTWAMHGFLMVLGAVSLSAVIASPVAVGILILIATAFFLVRHLFEFRAREDFYQRSILHRMNEKCKFQFMDEHGRQQVIQVEKWKKFEYLQANICFLELELKAICETNKLDIVNNKFYRLFNSDVFKKNVYNTYEQNKVLGESSCFFKNLKKILNRFFAFSGGSFYGYGLTEQIVWKSNLGIHTLVKALTLPILLIFMPLIIITGIANLITYHLHSRQRNRFDFVNNLDSKLEDLEQTRKNLLFLTALLSSNLKNSSDPVINLNAKSETQPDLPLSDREISTKKYDHFYLFKCPKEGIERKKYNHCSSVSVEKKLWNVKTIINSRV